MKKVSHPIQFPNLHIPSWHCQFCWFKREKKSLFAWKYQLHFTPLRQMWVLYIKLGKGIWGSLQMTALVKLGSAGTIHCHTCIQTYILTCPRWCQRIYFSADAFIPPWVSFHDATCDVTYKSTHDMHMNQRKCVNIWDRTLTFPRWCQRTYFSAVGFMPWWDRFQDATCGWITW